MSIHSPRVVVIGGGATGTGIAAEAARRGFAVTLVERGQLGSGTSSHFHGVLHSGARYAVSDPATAAACYQENQLLRSLIPSAIHDSGGLFVALNDREAAHADTILAACTAAGIPTRELTTAKALAREPLLNPATVRAFSVPDGSIDGREVIRLSRRVAERAARPATFLTYHHVTGLQRRGSRIVSVTIHDARSGSSHSLACDYVINAGGVWAGRITALADIPLKMVYDKGTMIAFQQQLTTAVINRCRPEDDGDLLVPGGGGSIIGTTSRVIDDPDDCLPTQEEADVLLREGAMLVPALKRAEASRIYAGVRPLAASFIPSGSGAADQGSSRAISRAYQVIDHAGDDIDNFISVTGGKVTLYRRMAASAVDMLCVKTDRLPDKTDDNIKAAQVFAKI